MKSIVKRTFEAIRFPQGSPERAKLNCCPTTSEYFPGQKWAITKPNFMSDGSINPVQPMVIALFNTRKEAEAAFSNP